MAPPRPVALSLQRFPEHAAIIGDMLLGYTDLEFLMVDLVGQAIGDKDMKTAAKIIYRMSGAYDRLNVADALLLPFMTSIRLHGPYSQWVGAMGRCRQIRNQYAHGGFRSDEQGRLTVANLKEAVGAAEATFEFHPLELSLLKEQQAYFGYAIDLTVYLMAEARFRKDRRRRHGRRLPKSRAKPSLYSPAD